MTNKTKPNKKETVKQTKTLPVREISKLPEILVYALTKPCEYGKLPSRLASLQVEGEGDAFHPFYRELKHEVTQNSLLPTVCTLVPLQPMGFHDIL